MSTPTRRLVFCLLAALVAGPGCVGSGARPRGREQSPTAQPAATARIGESIEKTGQSISAGEPGFPASLAGVRPVDYQANFPAEFLVSRPGDAVDGQALPGRGRGRGTPDDTGAGPWPPVPLPIGPTIAGETPSQPGTPAGDPITLAELESLALVHNPAIRQVAAASFRSEGFLEQVGLRPNPSIGYFADEVGNDNSAGLHGGFVSQTIVRGDKLALNRRVLSQDVQALRWEAEVQRRRVATDLRLQYIDALAAQRRLQLARDFHRVAQQGVQVAEKRFQAQEAAKPDVLQAEIQVNEIELTIRRAELNLQAAWEQLAALVGLPEMAQRPLAGELEIPATDQELEGVYQQLLAGSPQLKAACARVQRARANLERQGVQAVPNLAAQVGAGYDDGTGDEFATAQLSLPLPLVNKNQGNQRAAYAEYCRATQELRRLQLAIRANLAQVMQQYQAGAVAAERYRDAILPRAEETLRLSEAAYLAGEFNFLRILTARRAFLDANLQYVDALGEVNRAAAQIDGLLLTGGLTTVNDGGLDDGLRGQALSNQ